MTTIACNITDKQIAYDSRTTAGSRILSDSSNKLYIGENYDKFFLAGVREDCRDFATYFNPYSVYDRVLEASGFVVCGGDIYSTGYSPECGFWKSLVECNEAFGSGAAYALGAMDFGCSAKEAVKYACKRDVYTGGKIRVFTL